VRKLRPRRQVPLMKRYTVDCPDCHRKYDLDFTGPVKYCSFCKSDKIKVKHRPAPPSSLLGTAIQGLFMGAGFAVMDRYLNQKDSGKGKPGDYIRGALQAPKRHGQQEAKP
jgi:hypothetical protein